MATQFIVLSDGDKRDIENGNFIHCKLNNGNTVYITTEDSFRKCYIRDNLLVTIGMRAAYMESLGEIELPQGSLGEDNVTNFATDIAHNYMNDIEDIGFDEYIETALLEKYGKKGEN